MKKENLLVLRELFVTQMNYWSFFPLIVTCMVLIGNSVPGAAAPGMAWWAAFCVVPFLLYLVRVKCKFLLLFLLLHCVPTALAFSVPVSHSAYRALFICVMLGFSVYSFCLRLMTEDRLDRGMNPVAAVGMSGVCVYFLHYLRVTGWDSLCINVLIGTLGLYFVASWVDSFLNFLLVNKGSAGHIPERAMFRSGLGMSALYTLLGMAVLLVTANFAWLRAVLGTLWEIFRRTLVWIFSYFHFEPESEELVQETQDAAGEAALALEGGETFWLWIVLEYVAYIALAVGLVWALAVGTRRLLRFVRENWVGMRHLLPADGDAEGASDLHEKLGSDMGAYRERKTGSLLERLTPRERIRRLYRKQAAGLERVALLTARECETALELPGMAELYEKARYSGADCTTEDVKRMKAVCRRN